MALFARVAVAAAVYAIDRPYDYGVPEEFTKTIAPGMRVMVPFGARNKKTEGVVLSLSGSTSHEKVKHVEKLLDDEPLLDGRMLRLALWMRERACCTVYQAVRAMLPAGLWYVFEEMCALTPGVDREEAEQTLDENAKRLLGMLLAHGGTARRADVEAALGQEDGRAAMETLTARGLAVSSVKAARKTGDRTTRFLSLAVPAEEAVASLRSRSAPKQRAVLEFLTQYGQVSVRDVEYFTGATSSVINALLRAGLVYISEVEAFRKPAQTVGGKVGPIALNAEQQKAFDRFADLMDEGRPACGLLYGVTGSGKTAVYIRLVEHTIAMEGSALVLVPEIALTPQLMARFSAHFGDRVAILHSGLSGGERLDEFKRVRRGLVDVVVGTRSAVFAPLDNLRLVILDEEHEASYKSGGPPRYHARDVAKFRCVQTDALLVLGSATPSLESMHAAREGKITLGVLKQRFNEQNMPQVEMVDLRQELRQGNASTISETLRVRLDENIRRGQQSILFLNRRGASRMLLCGDCGHVPQCPRCSIALAMHSANKRLMCHLCGHSEKAPANCPACGGAFRPVGAGTQKVMEELGELFPHVKALRMDTDTTSGKGAHAEILERFDKQRVPILVGTQMVTKGLDFENVSLVGVLAADAALYMDDFRAHERTFALITQVVGRAGRGDKPGRAVIQTFHPEHPVLLAAARQDYDEFYREEIQLRRLQGLPPFGSLTTLTLFGLQQDDVLRACLRVCGLLGKTNESFRVMGPAPAHVVRVNMQYRYTINLLGQDTAPERRLISNLLTVFAKDGRNRGVHIYADPNPYE